MAQVDEKKRAKKQKYLRRWYKKNRKREIAAQKRRRLENPKRYKRNRNRWRRKWHATLKAKSLSRNGNPLLTGEERIMFDLMNGYISAYSVSPRQQRINSRKGIVAQRKKRAARLAAARKQLIAWGFKVK